MNPEHIRLIKSNLTTLSGCTTNFDDLVRHLIQANIITISDKEVLASEKTSKCKYSELYVLLFRKGTNAFEVLLEALRSTDNAVAYGLLTPAGNEAGSSNYAPAAGLIQITEPEHDFVVELRHLRRICEVLESSTTLRTNWNSIRRHILSAADVNALEGMEATREVSFYENLENTLQIWIESHGNRASFLSLLTALQDRRETRVAENLRQRKTEIQLSASN